MGGSNINTADNETFFKNKLKTRAMAGRLSSVTDETEVKKWVGVVRSAGLLKDQNALKAVAENVPTYDDLMRLKTHGFAKLTPVSQNTIRGFLNSTVSSGQDKKIETSLANFSKAELEKMEKHAGGADIPRHPNQRPQMAWGKFHNAAPAMLPTQFEYMEWYPRTTKNEDIRNYQIRFFTAKGRPHARWYTEGGTHATNAPWFYKKGPSTPWVQWAGPNQAL